MEVSKSRNFNNLGKLLQIGEENGQTQELKVTVVGGKDLFPFYQGINTRRL